MITAALVKELRERTGTGMMSCKKALVEANGDMEKAIEHLRKAGIAKAQKKASRSATDGVIMSYIHPGSKLGVLVEVNCETDFVARTKDFQDFVHNLTMHIAATNPLVIKREDLDPATVEKEKEIAAELTRKSGKPEHIIDRIVIGRMEKFYAENVLLEQTYIKENDKTIRDIITALIAKLGENITISQVARFELGSKAASSCSC